MKKPRYWYKTYKQLSKHEALLLENMEGFLVFSSSMVKRALQWRSFTVNNVLGSLKKKKIITSFKRNHYVVTSKIPENIFKIAVLAASPAYISFWTASSIYGFTEQQPKVIQVVSTKQYPKISIGNFTVETTTYQKDFFFGYRQFNNFSLAEKEKLLVDLLYKPEKSGGLSEVKKILWNIWSEIDGKKLLFYLEKFNNKSLFSRLGHLLEILGIKNNIEQLLLKHVPAGYVKLNPQKKTARIYDKKWRIIINDQ